MGRVAKKRTSRPDVSISLTIDKPDTFMFKAFQHARPVGHIYVIRRRVSFWDVVDIEVEHKREGVGTALYEAAAAEAGRRGGRLMSSTRVSPASEGFWQKQVAKGRAEVLSEGDVALKLGVRDLKNNAAPRPRLVEDEHRWRLRGLLWDAMSDPLGLGLSQEVAEEVVEAMADPDETSTVVEVVQQILTNRLATRTRGLNQEDVDDAVAAVVALTRSGGVEPNPSEPRGFPWPKKAPVYHATTAMRAILDHGFKTRRERGGAHALGGGTDIAVSFTFDRRTAIAIALGLRTIRGIVRGEIGLGDLIIQADQVAPGVLSQVRKNLEVEMHAVTPEDVARIDRGLRWFHSSILGGDLEKSAVEPFIEQGLVEVVVDHGYGVSGWIDGELLAQLRNEHRRKIHERLWPDTEFDNSDLLAWRKYGRYRSHIVQAYKTLLHFGGWDGESGRKLYDPLFFMTSLEPLATLDDRDIGVLRAHLDADWLCAGPKGAEALGFELPPVGAPTLYQWAEGCEVELDRGRYGERSPTPKTRAEYHSTLPRGWEPPDPSDTVALMSSMAEVRVWNTKLIRDVEEVENLRDVLSYARDAWDRKGFAVDEPFWMPFHRDQIPFEARR